jgi:hypothetical protein
METGVCCTYRGGVGGVFTDRGIWIMDSMCESINGLAEDPSQRNSKPFSRFYLGRWIMIILFHLDWRR